MSLLGPVVEPGPRRRPAEPQIVGSNPTRPAIFLRRVPLYWRSYRGILAALSEETKRQAILTDADERSRTAIALVANAGLRLETLGNESGTDGLTISDLPELVIKSKHTSFKQIPTMIVVRPELSKAGHRYFTFLTNEGSEYLSAFLDKRSASGETLRPSSPIIAVTP